MSKAVSSELTFVEHAGGCGCRPAPSQPEQAAPTPGAAVSSGYEPVDKSGRCGCCSSYYRSVWDRLCYQLFGYIPAGMDTEQILRGLVIWKDDVVLVDGNFPATFQVTATGQRTPLATDIIYYKEQFYNIGAVSSGSSDVYTCTECLPIEASVIEVYKTLVATNSRLEANEIVRRDRANQDHDRAVTDHGIASADHQQYGDDHFTAGQDHTRYEADHERAASDHFAASGDRSRAADDHARAESDHDYIESLDFSVFVTRSVDDLENYYKKTETYAKTEVDDELGGKQDVLESGVNIKTINNQSLLGSGNIDIQGGGGGDVSDVTLGGTSVVSEGVAVLPAYPTTLPASDVYSWAKQSTKPSYDYSEIGNTPSIPSALSELSEDTTHRVVTDTEKSTWNAKYSKPSSGIPSSDMASAVQASLGKADTAVQPEAGKGLFSGSYNDLTDKPTIPDAQIQSDWSQGDSAAKDYIKNKPTIPDISNCVQKSQTAGLLKNDGTVDTTSYGTYSKPSGGIPSSDLASAVQTSLGKADTAYQKPSGGIPASDIANGVIPSDPGTLDTTATTAQSTSASEALSGNVTLHKVSKTGSYNDLLNKPTIPAAQVNADWNASSGVAQILNKPTIPAAQVNADWNASSGVAQILNKPSIPAAGIPSGGTTGQVLKKVSGTDYDVEWDEDGGGSSVELSTNLYDDRASNAKASTPKSIYDTIFPGVGSSQPAGGMLPNVYYDLGTLTGAVTIAFAVPIDSNTENEYKFIFTAGSTAPTITWPNSITTWAGNCLDAVTLAPVITAGNRYEVSVVDGVAVIVEYL